MASKEEEEHIRTLVFGEKVDAAMSVDGKEIDLVRLANGVEAKLAKSTNQEEVDPVKNKNGVEAELVKIADQEEVDPAKAMGGVEAKPMKTKAMLEVHQAKIVKENMKMAKKGREEGEEQPTTTMMNDNCLTKELQAPGVAPHHGWKPKRKAVKLAGNP